MGILPRLQLASVILPFVLALTGCACDGDPGEGPNGQNGETGNITVSIITPADGELFSPEETIEFEGLAVDELDVKWFATDGGLGLWYGQ